MDSKRFEELCKISQNDEMQNKMNEAVQNIGKNHRQIIDDWCKAYMAQRYEEGKSIKPGDFILNQQECNGKSGQIGFKYWFNDKEQNEQPPEDKVI